VSGPVERSAFPAGRRFAYRKESSPLIRYNVVWVAFVDHALGIVKAVDVNGSAAAVQKDEVGVAGQPKNKRWSGFQIVNTESDARSVTSWKKREQ
jgi:hypothetical protein